MRRFSRAFPAFGKRKIPPTMKKSTAAPSIWFPQPTSGMPLMKSVKVLGVKETTAKIAAVTDTATGLTDGTLTIGDDILIEGEKLKVDEKDSAQGVFFCASDGKEYKTERRLSVNKPTQIMARVPASLPKGSVQIVIRTKFSGSRKPLKELREITYGYTCEAKS